MRGRKTGSPAKDVFLPSAKQRTHPKSGEAGLSLVMAYAGRYCGWIWFLRSLGHLPRQSDDICGFPYLNPPFQPRTVIPASLGKDSPHKEKKVNAYFCAAEVNELASTKPENARSQNHSLRRQRCTAPNSSAYGTVWLFCTEDLTALAYLLDLAHHTCSVVSACSLIVAHRRKPVRPCCCAQAVFAGRSRTTHPELC